MILWPGNEVEYGFQWFIGQGLYRQAATLYCNVQAGRLRCDQGLFQGCGRQRLAIGIAESGQHIVKILIAEQGCAGGSGNEQAAERIQVDRAHRFQGQVGMAEKMQGIGFFQDWSGDPGRDFKFNMNALRAILESIATVVEPDVVAIDEVDQARVADRFATQAPVAALVQAEPAIDIGHIRPLCEGAFDSFVHALDCNANVGGSAERWRKGCGS